MTITSYAQNFEDVILWRALKHVKRGTYIDLGAQDPVADSVSLAFYEQGWRGIHVEPNPFYAEKIRNARPGEEVIEAAVGVHQGTIEFFEVGDTGLSTGDAGVAEMHRESGFDIRRIEVSCLPFSKLLEPYEGSDIHWLKIDVEGMEEQVVASWSGSPVRPWLVVVESTKPNSSEQNFSSWQDQLLALGYEFVYFDGLNRFYVSLEHPELKASFGPGPNYFDDFTLTSASAFNVPLLVELRELRHCVDERTQDINRLSGTLRDAQAALVRATHAWELTSAALTRENTWKGEKIRELGQCLAMRENELREAKNDFREAKNELRQAKEVLASLYQSTSWKVTGPLRFASRLAKRVARGGLAWVTLKPGSRPRRVIGSLLSRNAEQSYRSRAESHKAASVVAQPMPSAPVPPVSEYELKTAAKQPGLIVLDQIDTSSEPETVQRLYQQLTETRKRHLKRS